MDLSKMPLEDLITIVLIAIHGYAVENSESLSVDKNVLAAVYDNAIANQKHPVLRLTHTDDNRLQVDVDMEQLDK